MLHSSCNQVGEEAVRLFTNDKLRIKLPVNIVADRVFTVRAMGTDSYDEIHEA